MSSIEQRTEALGLVIELGLLLEEDFRTTMGEMGINTTQASALWLLGERGPLRQREVADALQVSPRTVTELVDTLSGTGLVTREPHPSDRRAVLVVLTESGSRLYSDFQKQQGDFADLLFAGMSRRRFSEFRKGLDHVVGQLRSAIRP